MNQDIDVFHQFLTDTLRLHKPDGKVFENVKACVSGNKILIEDVHLPIEVGDKFTRTLPSGLTDELVVDDPGYCAKFTGIAAHYQVKVHPARAERTTTPRGTTYNVSGPNARVNINSSDHSTNAVALGDAQVFTNLRKAFADSSLAEDDRAKPLAGVEAMEQARSSPSFAAQYNDFIMQAGAYMSIVGPFLPALSALLTK